MSQQIPYIKTSGMRIGNNDVGVPTGLSELLNLAGVWKPHKPKKLSVLDYESSISVIDGQLTTTLTPINKKQKGVPA
ncbi:hypothetical protein [Bacillus subtilis]|uniref:hypothetical protein n=1 Tax=Bacillus subtilis TaxID=1423 RepID=UPI000C78319A|nr:hypothetical protein [Bacillus subtilis]PLV35309.1 hypothetical protein BSP2_37410 [Bacillus subtilis subsp. subtilis]